MIRATLETVLTTMKNIIVVIPEAWKFLPQGRGNPVKGTAESFIRQGATNGNFLFVDSQDMAGMDKLPLKQMPLWILGLQTERNEVDHTLDQMNVPNKQKPKPNEIMTLPLGHFHAVSPRLSACVYVQPAWMDEETARAIAMGKMSVEDVKKPASGSMALPSAPVPTQYHDTSDRLIHPLPSQDQSWIRAELAEMRQAFFDKTKVLEEMIIAIQRQPVPAVTAPVHSLAVNIEEIVGKVLQRIPVGGGTVKIEAREVVLKKFQQAEVDRILKQVESLSPWQKEVLKFVEAKGSQTTKAELLQRIKGKTANLVGNYKALYAEADALAEAGFLKSDPQKRFYQNLATGLKSSLESYKPTEQEITDVVGQILMRL